MHLYWEKGVFGGLYKIFSDDSGAGKLKNNSWSQTAEGELNREKYLFQTTGFWNQETRIINMETGRVTGSITYNFWRTEAAITCSGKTYFWKTKNLLHTAWHVTGPDGFQIDFYSPSLSKGDITTNRKDSVLILSGLYVQNFFWQMSLGAILAVFLPILLSQGG